MTARARLRGTDVRLMMTRVATAVVRAQSDPHRPAGPIVVHTEGDDTLGIAPLREPADIRLDFHSGSDRPLVGPSVRVAKRVMRRALRWYVGPMMAQQSEFNHAVLDLIEKLRLQIEQLSAEVESLKASGDKP